MTLLWNNALLTGNTLLDKQHKELIKRVGHFLKALETQGNVTMALYSHTKNGINTKTLLLSN